MNNEFEGKVAAVTGAASGIGEAIVRALLARGASIAALDINADLLSERQSEFGSRFLGIVGDVTDEGAVAHFISNCMKHFGGLQMAFNVAGSSRGGAIMEQTVQNWNFTVDLCLKGVFLCMKHEAVPMLSGGGGAIVNVSSICAHLPVSGAAPYCSAKAGVEMLTKVAAIELAEGGIRVNAILPGYTHTPGIRPNVDSPQMDKAVVDRIPLRRAATPAEIAAPALFLASNDARYIAGASLIVDGGWVLRGIP